MVIITQAKVHFNRLMGTLIFGIPPSRPGERLKRPGLIGLRLLCNKLSMVQQPEPSFKTA